MRRRVIAVGSVVISAAIALSLLNTSARSAVGYVWSRWHGPYTVEQRLVQFGAQVAARLEPAFAGAGLPYPPYEVAYLAFKDKRVVELYARGSARDPWRFVKEYAVLGASGRPGPKLAEGDYQVPEGIYQADFLNPNSRFHVSIRLNYPNEHDRDVARLDGRVNLGGDIMIHGSSASIGCLAMGDESAEELFTLAALVTKQRTHIVVSPTDFRLSVGEDLARNPRWVAQLYELLRVELARFQREPDPSFERTSSGELRQPTAATQRQR